MDSFRSVGLKSSSFNTQYSTVCAQYPYKILSVFGREKTIRRGEKGSGTQWKAMHAVASSNHQIFYMDDILQSRIDIWTEVLSYISQSKDIANWHCVSKTALVISRLCHSNVSIIPQRRQDWLCVAKWLCSLERMASLEIHKSNCTHELIKPLVAAKRQAESMPVLNMAITKCFSMSGEIASSLSICRNAALCDISFINEIIHPSECKHLQALILSNCTFNEGRALAALYSAFPPSLTFFGLGGCKEIYPTSENFEAVLPCRRSNLVIDVTFLQDRDRHFVQYFFPCAYKVDFCQDSCDYLDVCLRLGGLMHNPIMQSALLTCSNNRNQTPLHLACLGGLSPRTQWLLHHRAKADLKDAGGSTPLHRATSAHGPGGLSTVSDGEVGGEAGELWACCVRDVIKACPENCFTRNHYYDTPIYAAALCGNVLVLREILRHITHSMREDVRTDSITDKDMNIDTSTQSLPKSGKGRRRGRGMRKASSHNGNDPHGMTHAKCSRHRCRLIHTERSLDVRCSDYRGFSPLHAAVISKSLECCHLLLDKSWCCPRRVNCHGSTPVDLSCRYTDIPEIRELLASAIACGK